MTHIVTTTYRDKRPARKRKAVALEGPAVVRKRSRADAVVPPDHVEDPTPANDDRKPAIVTRKRARPARDEQHPAEPDDPEADAAVRVWLERAKWGHGPAR
jgi:hypothetical protein